VLSVYSHTSRLIVCEPEHLRRREDVKHLPDLIRPAAEARGEWLQAQVLDPLAWDEAVSVLREITTADGMLAWLRQQPGVVGNSVGLMIKRLENWLDRVARLSSENEERAFARQMGDRL
jgi:hypothetical protein